MSIRLYKSYTPGTRNRALSGFTEITKLNPKKSYYKKIIETKVEIIEVSLQFVIEVAVIKDATD
jgi:hypothetical protein